MLTVTVWPLSWIYTDTANAFLIPFLMLSGFSFVLCVVLREFGARVSAETEVIEPAELEVYEAAYLSGDTERVADAAMAGMYRGGRIGFDKPRRVRVKAEGSDAFGSPTHTVHEIALAGGRVKDVRKAVAHGIDKIEYGLVKRGLALSKKNRWKWRWASASPFVLLSVAGVWRIWVGWQRGESFGIVIVLTIVTMLAALIAGCGGMLATREGKRAVRKCKCERTKRMLTKAGSSGDWAWLCALYGVNALPKDGTEEIHRALAHGTSGSSDGDADGDNGCSGCSGCGGCGGCGD